MNRFRCVWQHGDHSELAAPARVSQKQQILDARRRVCSAQRGAEQEGRGGGEGGGPGEHGEAGEREAGGEGDQGGLLRVLREDDQVRRVGFGDGEGGIDGGDAEGVGDVDGEQLHEVLDVDVAVGAKRLGVARERELPGERELGLQGLEGRQGLREERLELEREARGEGLEGELKVLEVAGRDADPVGDFRQPVCGGLPRGQRGLVEMGGGNDVARGEGGGGRITSVSGMRSCMGRRRRRR